MMFPMRSWCFMAIHINKFNYLADKRLAPKAEVTGSNPVGCANLFNNLDRILHCPKSACPDYVRIMCSRAVL